MSLKTRLGIVIGFDCDLLAHVLFTRLHWDRRFAGPFQDRWTTREALEAVCNDIAVKRVEFHQERIATTLLGTDHRRATTAEEVEDVLTLHRRVLHRANCELRRLLSQMRHGLRIDLLDLP